MILGETLLGQSSQVYYRFSRPQAMTEWWQWLVLASVVLVVGAYVVWMYRRDSMELPRTTCWVLSMLRLLVFAGILFFFLLVGVARAVLKPGPGQMCAHIWLETPQLRALYPLSISPK